MDNRKRIFIVNPTAGRGKATEISKIIKNLCDEKQLDYDILYTNDVNDATAMAKNYMNNHIVYSVGGDGTISEIVNGLVGGSSYLGIIPAGSGNDFYKTTVGLKPVLHTIDLGLVNKKFFINIASLGFDAEVANNVFLMKEKHIPRTMLYNASIVYSLFYKNDPIVRIESGSSKEITLMAICNGKYYGNGFKIAPSADISDGLFDVYVVDKLNVVQILKLALKLKKGLHEQSIYIDKKCCSSLSVEADKPLLCNVDGEIMKADKFNFSIIGRALRLYNKDDLGINEYVKKLKV